MSRIPNDIIQQVIDLDIEEVVQEYITLSKRGSAYTACCPFHNEKTPSFFVSPAKGIYKCFGCGKGGGNIEFVMEHEGLSFREAVEELCAKFKIDIPKQEQTPEEIQAEKHRESIFAAMLAAQKLYTATKDIEPSLQNFLAQRQISQETAEKFGIGYCKESMSLTATGWNRQILAECGIEYNGTPVFADRITFPIHNINGQVVGFTARAIGSQSGAERLLSGAEVKAKYINTKAYQFYNKSEILYNLNRSKHEIRKQGFAIVLEGQMDVIALDQAGIQNTVASSGTAFTDAQCKLLRKFTDVVVVLFDGDKAGIAALEKSMPNFLSHGFEVYSCILPNGQDPDEYVRANGVDGFNDYLRFNKKDFISQLLSIYDQAYQADIISCSKIVRKITDLLKLIKDATQLHYYSLRLANITGIPYAVIQPDFSNIFIKKK
jgi:DNA primase